MSKNLSIRDNDVDLDLIKNANSWDEAIAAAKREIVRLEQEIQYFEEMKAAGEPWPGNDRKNQRRGVTRGDVRCDD